MRIDAPALLLAARPHGETAAIARLLTEEHGVIAAYVAGGRGRRLRPVLVPGNRLAAELRARSPDQLPFARLELVASRGAWLGEPLTAAAIAWLCALTATTLPERNAYPAFYEALGAALDAVCHAPSARGWVGALVGYEALLLRELGYGGRPAIPADFTESLARMDALGPAIARYLLADRRGDVMAARDVLRMRLGRMDSQ